MLVTGSIMTDLLDDNDPDLELYEGTGDIGENTQNEDALLRESPG